MQKISLTLSAAIITLLLGSCSDSSQTPPTAQQTPPAASPTPTVPGSPTATKPQDFPTPVEAGSQKGAEVAGLYPPINSDQRIAEVAKGRQDPFALFPVPPKVTVEIDKTAGGVVSPSSAIPSISPMPLAPGLVSRPTQSVPVSAPSRPSNITPVNKIRTIPKLPKPTTNTKPGSSLNKPKPIAIKPQFVLPPLPQPREAQGVAITGLININGVTQAIVKAPNEAASRYVSVGQYLSGGQVLVKRIEMSGGPSPTVVLEQFGIEVAKKVGEKPLEEKPDQAEPTAQAYFLPNGAILFNNGYFS